MADLIKLNSLWVLLTLPIITAPGAMAGLLYTTNKLVKNQPFDTSTFIEGFQEYFWVGWRYTLLNIVAFLTIFLNVEIYQNMAGSYQKWLVGILIGLGVIWTALQVHVFPLLIEQKEKRVMIAIRMSMVLLLRHPGPTYFTTIILLLLLIFSVWLFGIPWLIFMAGLYANLMTITTMYAVGKTEYVDPLVR
jgi:hypothetical protein